MSVEAQSRGAKSANVPSAQAARSGQPFRLPLTVYYEDTDAAGVVYYANYLKFMERARTEWLGSLGFAVADFEAAHGVVFVVHRMEIEYRAPARLGDRVEATLELTELGRARMVALQQVRRGTSLLAQARVTLACVEREHWRPARIPAVLHGRLEKTI